MSNFFNPRRFHAIFPRFFLCNKNVAETEIIKWTLTSLYLQLALLTIVLLVTFGNDGIRLNFGRADFLGVEISFITWFDKKNPFICSSRAVYTQISRVFLDDWSVTLRKRKSVNYLNMTSLYFQLVLLTIVLLAAFGNDGIRLTFGRADFLGVGISFCLAITLPLILIAYLCGGNLFVLVRCQYKLLCT